MNSALSTDFINAGADGVDIDALPFRQFGASFFEGLFQGRLNSDVASFLTGGLFQTLLS